MMMIKQAIQPGASLAVIGMDLAWAGCEGADDFEQVTYAGHCQYSGAAESERASGHAVGESLLERMARGALRDAGFGTPEDGRVAVLSASGQPVQKPWEWAARFADISGSANPLVEAVDQAHDLLVTAVVDVVVFTAESVPYHLPGPFVPGLGFERDAHGWRPGEGAGAVVLARYDRPLREGRRIYAGIRSLAYTPGSTASEQGQPVLPGAPVLEQARACIQAALETAGVSPEQVGYVEAFASGVDGIDGVEIASLAHGYRQKEQDFTTALGSAQTNAGYLGPAAGLAGLIHAALCLYHREIPGAPGWKAPKLPALWRGSGFYVPAESRAWFHPSRSGGRLAGVNVIGLHGSMAHLVLGEAAEQPVRSNQALGRGGFFLFPTAGESPEALLASLEALRSSLAQHASLSDAAAEAFEAAKDGGAKDLPLALAIAGHNHEEVLREIEMAMKAIPGAVEKGADWQTPAGSYFTPAPVGQYGGVALVYPGAFNSYPGVGKDLFRLFPDLHQRAEMLTGDMGRVMRERMLYPRSLTSFTKEEMARLEARLLEDPIAMLISGTAMAVLYTHIMVKAFGIHPSAAFGYSLGENSMMYATGAWGQGDGASRRLEESNAFRSRLAGAQLAVRESWGLRHPNGSGPEPLWSNFLVMGPPDLVRAALENEPRVYLTHINTPRQVVIGGDPDACRRVVARLGFSSLQAPFDYALHCAPIRSEAGALADLHDWPVEQDPGIPLYSAADYEPLRLNSHEISEKIGQMLVSPLDFPRLVRRVYDSGARVFIEAGAGGNCARWIGETLKDEPHLALSLNRRGMDDLTTLVRACARLFSHRVPIDLSVLYQPISTQVNQ